MIKPCPFCGSKPLILSSKMHGGGYVIGCSNLECIIYLPDDAMKSELHNYGWCYKRKDEMIKDWNRRYKEDSDVEKI